MSKILNASCSNNVVTCQGLPLSGVTILSEGVGPSTGVLIIQEEKLYYVAQTSPDLKLTLDTLNQVITKLISIISSIGAGMTGPTTAPPGTLPADLTALNLLNTQLTNLKNMLR